MVDTYNLNQMRARRFQVPGKFEGFQIDTMQCLKVVLLWRSVSYLNYQKHVP